MQKIIKTNIPVFDSIKITIPISKLDYLDPTIQSEYIKVYPELGNYTTSELETNNQITIIRNGIRVRIGLQALNISGFNKEFTKPTKCITTVITSKFLGNKYFDGINNKNIEIIYNELMEMNIFKCSLKTFKTAKYSDTDICLNRYVESQQSWNDILKQLIQQSGTKQKFFNHFNDVKNNNIGLEINTRNKATASTPYIKFYHKEFELKSEKNIEFYKKYLEKEYSNSIKNLTRVEVTIRNSAHRKRLVKKGITSQYKNLGELLEMPKKEMYNVITSSLNEYIIKMKRVKTDKLSPTEYLIFEMIQHLIELGMSYNEILSIAKLYKGSSDNNTKMGKARTKKIINKLFDLAFEKDAKIREKNKINTEVKKYLNFLGIN